MSAIRGCLAVLVGGVVFLAVLAWFALPPLAGAVVTAGLATSGLSGTGTTVVVDASPPFELLDLHADAIEVHSTDVSWRGVEAATLELRLTGVDLGARTAVAVTGRLDGVTIPTSQGSTPVERIDLDGPSSSVQATLTLDSTTVARLAANAVETAIGRPATTIELQAPDRVIVTVGSQRVESQVVVENGALVIDVPPLGRAVLAEPSGDLPFLLRSVSILPGGGATLLGTVDPHALGLGH